MPRRRVYTVAIYARRSKRGESLSITIQLERCREAAADEGWRVGGEYQDQLSAYAHSRERRPGYEAMLADLDRFDAVLIYKADRLTRGDDERRAFERAADAAGVWLVATASGGRYDITTADGQRGFREAIIAAEHYSRQLSERLRDHHKMLRDTGRDSGGMRPFGFEPDRVTLRESEAAVIRDAARRVLAGDSLRAICARLNAAGERTSHGGVWRPTRLRRMLTAPRYNGRREVDGVRGWEPILDDATFETVGALLADPARRTVESTARRHLLPGFVWCGSCGHRLHSHGRDSTRVYRCHGGNGPDPGCGRVSVHAVSLDEHVYDLAYRRVEHRIIEDGGDGPIEPANAEELAVIDDRLREAGRLFATGEIDAVGFAAASRELRDQRAALLAAAPRRRRPRFTLIRDPEAIRAPWEGDSTGLDQYRSILAMAVDRVIVHPAERRGSRFDPSRAEIFWATES